MGIKLYRYRTFKKNWKEEAFDGIVEPSSPLYFNDPYDCDFCFQEDISDEIHERKDYVEMVKKYIPLRKEEQDRILHADDLERALRMVFWAHGKSIQGSVKAFLRNDMSEMTNELRDAVRVVCLSETYDSMLMWSHYARNHTGYCIEYEFNKDDMYYSSLHLVRYTKDCIFRKNCASVPEERSAIPLQTEQSSAGLLVTVVYSTISARKFKTICLGCHSA